MIHSRPIVEAALAHLDPVSHNRQVFVVGDRSVVSISHHPELDSVSINIDDKGDIKYLYFPMHQIHYLLTKDKS